MRPRRRLAAGAVVALSFALSAADGVAVAQPIASPAVVVLRSVAFEPGPAPAAKPAKNSPDAELIGKVLGTSTAGGAGWQNQQGAMGPWNAKLEAVAGRRLVPNGATEYSLVVRLSGAASSPGVEATAAHAARAVGVPVTVEYMNTPSLKTMLAATTRFGPGIEAAQDGVDSVAVDEMTSEVAIAVIEGVADTDLVRRQAASTFGAAGIPFRVDSLRADESVGRVDPWMRVR